MCYHKSLKGLPKNRIFIRFLKFLLMADAQSLNYIATHRNFAQSSKIGNIRFQVKQSKLHREGLITADVQSSIFLFKLHPTFNNWWAKLNPPSLPSSLPHPLPKKRSLHNYGYVLTFDLNKSRIYRSMNSCAF